VFISYAQNFEDVMLWRALGHIENGFYIDIGAQDPVVDSVSQAFYERGWRGIHVEPVPAHAQALREARPDETIVQVAIGAGQALIPIYEIPDTGLSTSDADFAQMHANSGLANRRIDVACISLAVLLEQWPEHQVHWLKIDVEGMEGSVLRSWLPSAVRPWIVVVEATIPRSPEPSYQDWEGVVLELGYCFAYFDGLNRFYVSDAHPELLEAFGAPPNVFDGFALSGKACNSFCSKLVSDAAKRESDLSAKLLAGQEQAGQDRESLVASHRTQLEAVERIHLNHAQTLRESLRSAQDTMASLAEVQREDRAQRVAAQLELEATGRELERLTKTIETLEVELAHRESRWRIDLDRSQAETARFRLQSDRRSHASASATDKLRQDAAQMRERHERQVSKYLEELERSNVRISVLTAHLSAATHPRARDRLHRRFAHFATHPIVASLLSMRGTLNQAMELIMDAPLFTRTNYQPAFVANSEGRYRLDDFLVLHDRNFVQAGYKAILRREADPDGLSYYLQQIRSGASKARVLDQLLRSVEAKPHRTVIQGLSSHLRITRLCEAPIVGRIVSATLFLVSINEHLRDLRVLENHVIRIAEEAQTIHESNMHKLRSMVK
jgi:FkbM family methyltransferase